MIISDLLSDLIPVNTSNEPSKAVTCHFHTYMHINTHLYCQSLSSYLHFHKTENNQKQRFGQKQKSEIMEHLNIEKQTFT